jgi:hypothetical protein
VTVQRTYKVIIGDMFVSLENLNDYVDISRVWKYVREQNHRVNKKCLGCEELRQHKHWFHEGRSKLLPQSRHTKLQCVQNLTRLVGGILTSVRVKSFIYMKKSNCLEIKGTNRNICY